MGSRTLLSISVCLLFIGVAPESLNELVPDSDVRNLTLDFMRLCPLTRLCNVDIDGFTNQTAFRFPCCGPCRCDRRCVQRNDCCPDLLPEIPPVPEQPPLKQCVRLKYRDDGTEYMFEVYANCPREYSDMSVLMKCIQDYHQYNFEDGISGLGPVTDGDTGLTYKNIHCLRCNSGNQDAAMYWNLVAECELDMHRPPILLPNSGFLLSDGCNIVFDKPEDPTFVSPRTCRKLVRECSDASVDKMTERYCHAYTSVFKNYRNVHCALCNGWNNTGILEDDCDIEVVGPARQLPQGDIDINGMVEGEALEAKRNENPDVVADAGFVDCRPARNISFVEDNQGSCVSRHCPGFAFLHGNTCRPFYKGATNFPVLISVRLYPKKTIRLNDSSIQSFQKEIDDKRTEFKNRPSQMYIVAIFTYDLSVKIDEVMNVGFPPINITKSGNPVVEFLELDIQIYPKFLDNVTTFIEDCIHLYRTGFGKQNEFTEEYVGQGGLIKSFNQHLSFQWVLELPEDLQQLYGVTGAVIEDDGKIRLFMVKQSVGFTHLDAMLVTPITLCSQVVLNASRFQRDVGENGEIRVTVAGTDVPLSKVVFGNGYNELLMCETDFGQISTLKKVNETKKGSNDISCATRFYMYLESTFIILMTLVTVIGM